MKIGITCYPTYGGSGAVATELGIELARRGHEVHFISYAQPFRLTHFREGVYFHEVEVNRYPLFEFPPYSLALAVSMHEVVSKHELDLLHVHYAVPHATTGWIAREMIEAEGGSVKLVTTLHGTDITLVGQDPSFWSITKFSIERSDGLSAVSEWLREHTLEAFECPECAIRVIPNFVDPNVYDRGRYECHRKSLASDDEKILMHISNFRSVKRVEDVIRIFQGVARKLPARLVLIGDGPDRQSAADLAESTGLTDRVLFLGKLESVAELLACADLFLLPSAQESFGLVALEAQSSGVPVVGTSGSGLQEVVEDGSTGFLLPVGHAEEMADAALTLLRDEGRWRSFSEAGRAHATSRFATERVVPRYEEYYEEVLRGTARSVKARADS
ncbi:MAG: N-acetyl-alpha-D-glucosaminyl L-malate synthase BshA [Gemmatimonadota bacterium]